MSTLILPKFLKQVSELREAEAEEEAAGAEVAVSVMVTTEPLFVFIAREEIKIALRFFTKRNLFT